MIHVAGGTYIEECVEPRWSELFGSGVRGAAALCALSDAVELTTYVAAKHLPILAGYAATFGFALAHTAIEETLSFSYQHGLSVPSVYPSLSGQRNAHAVLRVDGENVLRFGMLEGDALVHGTRVVYDPQSEDSPQSFRANGSTAEHLCVVVNYEEASALLSTSAPELRTIGRFLRDRDGAEAVVVKRGVRGAAVIETDRITSIPVHPTEHVWPIGSGDVFAAVFAHYWAEQALSAVDAAERASLATAYYCASRALPIPRAPGAAWGQAGPPLVFAHDGPHWIPPRAYIAGPFFTMAQRWLVDEVRAALARVGLAPFSPYHDVGFGRDRVVAPADLAAIGESAVVVAIGDGLDAGTLFEVGYARAIGVPVVALVENVREGDLVMLTGTGCTLCPDLATAVYRAAWAALAR